MRNFIQYFMIFQVMMLLVVGCSEDTEDPKTPGDDNNENPNGTVGFGTIYFEWASDGLQKIDLETGQISLVLENNLDRSGFDISWDGKQILTSTDDPDDYDAEIYTISNLEDGSIVTQFKKYSGYANHTYPKISPDGKLIAVPPTFDDGVLIMDLQGNILHNLTGINNEEFESRIAWMPDNTLLVATEKNLYRTDTEFVNANFIKTFDYEVWGGFSPSPDGKQIAVRAGNHIYIMDATGENMVQVTDGNTFENWPVFSPDGQYLLVGTDPIAQMYGGYFYHMRIIPLDGQIHNVNENADPLVIPIILENENNAAPYYAPGIWR